ncbi:hypothetical protein [Streptomyces sp. NPDC012888]|uniref:hypothetical protein n=1 Tax=Streptomyces sp. NPDC012888 TaxID=3364855 RepID=UPI003677E4C7
MAADGNVGSEPWIPGGSMRAFVNNGLIASQGKALYVEKQSMVEYRKRVDKLLDQLKGSDADHGRFAEGTLGSGALGKGFSEAEDLHTAYNKVRAEMENLSKVLADQIEALSIAIEASRVGYDNMDEDVKARMRAIQKRAEAAYVPDRDPGAKANHKNETQTGQQPQPDNGDGSTSGGGH